MSAVARQLKRPGRGATELSGRIRGDWQKEVWWLKDNMSDILSRSSYHAACGLAGLAFGVAGLEYTVN
jgi:hypothetical protein